MYNPFWNCFTSNIAVYSRLVSTGSGQNKESCDLQHALQRWIFEPGQLHVTKTCLIHAMTVYIAAT